MTLPPLAARLAGWLGTLALMACTTAKAPVLPQPPPHTSATPVTAADRAAPPKAQAGTEHMLPPPTSTSEVKPSPVVPSGPSLTRVLAAGDDRSWVLGCTQDHKVRLSSSVLEERTLDAWLGVSADTRFIVVSEQGRWLLLDTRSGARVDLDEWHVDRRRARASGIRSLAFHPEHPLLALVLREDQRLRIRLYALDTQRFEDLALDLPDLFRLVWDPSGRGLHLETIPEDSNGNGHIDWPEPELPESHSDCSTPDDRFRVFAPRGDRVQSAVLATPWLTGERHDALNAAWVLSIAPAPGFLSFTADGGWLARVADRLMVTHATTTSPLFPDDCDGRVLAVHRPTANILVRCAFPKQRSELRWVSSARTRVLPVDSPYQGSFDRRGIGERFLPLYVGERSLLVDLAAGALVDLLPREQLLLQSPGLWLVRRGDTVRVRGSDMGEPSELVNAISSRARLRLGSGAAWVEPFLLTLQPSPRAERLPGKVHWLTGSGCALFEREPSEAGSTGLGSLAWACPDDGPAPAP